MSKRPISPCFLGITKTGLPWADTTLEIHPTAFIPRSILSRPSFFVADRGYIAFPCAGGPDVTTLARPSPRALAFPESKKPLLITDGFLSRKMCLMCLIFSGAISSQFIASCALLKCCGSAGNPVAGSMVAKGSEASKRGSSPGLISNAPFSFSSRVSVKISAVTSCFPQKPLKIFDFVLHAPVFIF